MVELNVQVAHELPLPTIGMKNVLVVDDVAVMRTIISRVLRNLEVESVQAADGCEAFELLSKQSVNAVITDIEMPIGAVSIWSTRCGSRKTSELQRCPSL